MCTVIKEGQKPVKARKNRYVYKACLRCGEDKVTSIYTSFEYEKNRLYETEMEFTRDNCCFDAVEINYKFSLDNPVFIGQGFHSLASLDMKRLHDSCFEDVFCRFIIPKGALYYKNEVGNIVSNKIIFKEICAQ